MDINLKKPEDINLVHQKYNYICQYCGYDGRSFKGWLQLNIDHIVPRHQNGDDSLENLITCCSQCNSITSRMVFEDNLSKEEIIKLKKDKVNNSLISALDTWRKYVVPNLKYSL